MVFPAVYDKAANFRFYEELNDFLPENKRKIEYSYAFYGTPAVKDAIEAEGVPHTEVDLILVNGKSVGFDYLLQHSDRVSVYPVFETLDISPVIRLREKPLRESKFILDVHLGKLTKLLRRLGFDSNYRNDYSDPEIVNISLKEKRIILTRDRGILKINKNILFFHKREGDMVSSILKFACDFIRTFIDNLQHIFVFMQNLGSKAG